MAQKRGRIRRHGLGNAGREVGAEDKEPIAV